MLFLRIFVKVYGHICLLFATFTKGKVGDGGGGDVLKRVPKRDPLIKKKICSFMSKGDRIGKVG